jgi:MFS family permease
MMLLVCAAFIGFGFGSCQPATMALAVDFVSPDERGMAASTYFIGFDAGIAIGSIALGEVVDLSSFGVMWIVAAMLVSCGLFAILKMPQNAAN